jgi:hypothetical protein
MRKISSIVGAALLLAASICAATPASAGVGSHCAYRLDPIERTSNGVVRARLVQVGCFATFAEALLFGSGGTIHLPSGTTPASLTERQLNSQSTVGRASVLIGTEYNGTGFGGTSNDYFASSTCTASTTWEVANVTATWNDLFESGKGFGGCDTNKKFRDTGFGGTVATCTPNCSDYGALDNQVSSLRWRI